MSAATLLVEILTEELPPKALSRLGRAFADSLRADLAREGLLADGASMRWFATPRRLAAQITQVREAAPDKPIETQGPSVKAALDAQGKPTKALEGFARKVNVAIDTLEQLDTPKGRVFVYRGVAPGARLAEVLAAKVAAALKALPIPKVMRWGAGDAEFVRPAHGLVMLHGTRVVPGSVLDIASGNTTLGHRFMSAGPVTIDSADAYEQALREHGGVIASFEERRRTIETALADAAGDRGAFERDESLLDEVTALVEAPAVYQGRYDEAFLEVPPECLVLSMKQHQKYFPLVDPASRRLVARFLVVSNLPTRDPANIVHGNERVLRARLADARFFYDQDRKVRLEARVPELAHVVYHNRLGTQLQRVERVERLAGEYAAALSADAQRARRAARLAKADLITGMVGEFPELQGIMGRYYALHDGEDREVADAIEAHYRPRFAGDALPESHVGCAVALADKLETLAGFFGIGQQPTGDKDPYALRRQALGVVRILAERSLPLRLSDVVVAAYAAFDASHRMTPAPDELLSFFYERMRGYLGEAGYSASEIDAVLALRPDRVDLILRQLEAVRTFNTLPEAPSLAAANKRIGNILRKSSAVPARFDTALLVEEAEKALASRFSAIRHAADSAYEVQDYTGMLQALAGLKEPVDAFFDRVMVMTDDARLRDNRIALLAELQQTMNRIADISKLAA
ncbi:MAG TPA: glycine--tRNA ligase subunit beta [Burkholderiales bacterium]|nr:glycine--tRNA ligase subunit beta [Burkholderiales bacterium]